MGEDPLHINGDGELRTLVLPVMYIATMVFSLYFILAVIEGFGIEIGGLLKEFGVQ